MIKTRHFRVFDSYERDPGPDYRPEAIAAQIAAYEARGRAITICPPGFESKTITVTERQKEARGTGGKKNAKAQSANAVW